MDENYPEAAARPGPDASAAASSAPIGARPATRAAWLLPALCFALLLGLAWWVLARYAQRPPQNDHVLHVRLAAKAARGGGWPPHFLFHLVLNALTGFSGEIAALRTASAVVLTVAVGAKLRLARPRARALLVGPGAAGRGSGDLGAPPGSARVAGPIALAGLWIAVFFASPIVNWWMFPRIYVGQFTPNVWHNPTAIAALPFALASLLPLVRSARPTRGGALASGILLAVSALVKPNFALAFLPAVAIHAAIRRWPLGLLARCALPATLVLAFQLSTGFEEERGSGIAFEPLTVWLKYTEFPAGATHALGSLLVSFAFPVAFALLFGRHVRARGPLVLAWLALAVALVQFLLFAETGEWLYHGNFFWGTVPCLYLVFAISIVELGRLDRARLGPLGRAGLPLVWILLLAHVASGVLFWLHSLQGWMHNA